MITPSHHRLVLSFFIATLGSLVGFAASAASDSAPLCSSVGTRSEGWYSAEPPADGESALIRYDQCGGCTAECRAVGTRSQGWYNSCDDTLIDWAKCDGTESPSCSPYICNDGTQIDRCASDGTVINYFAAPCMTHGGEVDTSRSFSDVPATHANAEAIAYVKAEGIVSGYADGTFRPDQTINRAEFLKIVLEAQATGYTGDGPSPSPSMNCFFHGGSKEDFRQEFGKFNDVEFTSWYAPYFCSGIRSGIVRGYPDQTFRPAQTINFVEAAKIIVTTDAYFGGSLTVSRQGNTWYEGYVRALAERKAIPLSITSFGQVITRGEMAEMVWRLKVGMIDKPSRTYEQLSSDASYKLLSLPSYTVKNYARNIVYRYAITAPSTNAVVITNQSFTFSGGRWQGPQIAIYNSSSYNNQIDTWASDDNWTGGDTAVLKGNLVTPASQTRYRVVTVDIGTPADMGFTVSAKHSNLDEVVLQSE